MRIAEELVNSETRSTRSATWRPRHKIGGLLLFFICGAPICGRIKAGTDSLKSCSKNGDVPKSSLFQSAAMVPIGRHNFNCRRWFVPRAPFPCASGPGALATGPVAGRSKRNAACRFSSVTTMSIKPQGAEEEDAARGGLPRDETSRPLRKTLREESAGKAEAIRRARKLARKKLQREGLLPMKPRTIPGAPGREEAAARAPLASDNNRNRRPIKSLA